MAFSTIEVDQAAGVLTITLCRPDALNALVTEMTVELAAALRMAQRDEHVRCLIITGAGRAFCSGQDLCELPSDDAAAPESEGALGRYLRERINPLVTRLRTMEKPVLAAVNGVAAGAGVSLALATDLRVCARSASFKLAFAQVGLVPDAGATLTLMQHVGYARAAELCLLGEAVAAERALEIGLVNRVVEDERLLATARQIAESLLELPPRALALTKRALARAWTATLEDQLDYEAWLQGSAARTADHHEAVAAFLEKRPPRFEGR